MFKLGVVFLIFLSFASCQKQEDSEELFMKAEGFLKLNMYKEALDIYIELKSREYKTEVVNERIKLASSKLAKEKLQGETKAPIRSEQTDVVVRNVPTTSLSEFKVSRCDNSYNERIENIKNEMKPYQEELAEIDKKLAKISSEYKIVQKDGVYHIAVSPDIPKEKQREIAEGPAREFGTLNARKNEVLQLINRFDVEISKVLEEARKAGQPSDCLRR
ncbi:MAG: hypothetical protein N2746_05095 [Deltaproteobacteria bacterium]|nr:hypothetical protein [Deltaproteobacteria bacterium]